jgi:hypothetical protein
MQKIAWWVVIALGVALLTIQLVPYGHSHENPRVRAEPPWDPGVRTLAVRACFDCHSNETVWPWYSNVAPASWLTQSDVDEGRKHLNFSECDRPQEDASEMVQIVENMKMPMWYYPARLSTADRAALVRGLAGISPERIEKNHEERD